MCEGIASSGRTVTTKQQQQQPVTTAAVATEKAHVRLAQVSCQHWLRKQGQQRQLSTDGEEEDEEDQPVDCDETTITGAAVVVTVAC